MLGVWRQKLPLNELERMSSSLGVAPRAGLLTLRCLPGPHSLAAVYAGSPESLSRCHEEVGTR